MTCNNICERYGLKLQNSNSNGKRISPYSVGLRYCRICDFFFDTSLSYCFCCGLHLRCNPVNKKRIEVFRY